MNTLPDFFTSFLSKLPEPPTWMVFEGHNRIVLMLNHVLQQEPEAMQRLARQKGRVVKFAWQKYSLLLTPSALGLMVAAEQLEDKNETIDLLIEVIDTDVVQIGKKMLLGDKPTVRIEGDVQLAAEVQWLTQNVEWDMAGDLARIVGNVCAHQITSNMHWFLGKLRAWVAAKS